MRLLSVKCFFDEFVNRMQFFLDRKVVLIVLSYFGVVGLITFFTCHSEDALDHLSDCESLLFKLYQLLSQHLCLALKSLFFNQLFCQVFDSHLEQDSLFLILLSLSD